MALRVGGPKFLYPFPYLLISVRVSSYIRSRIFLYPFAYLLISFPVSSYICSHIFLYPFPYFLITVPTNSYIDPMTYSYMGPLRYISISYIYGIYIYIYIYTYTYLHITNTLTSVLYIYHSDPVAQSGSNVHMPATCRLFIFLQMSVRRSSGGLIVLMSTVPFTCVLCMPIQEQ